PKILLGTSFFLPRLAVDGCEPDTGFTDDGVTAGGDTCARDDALAGVGVGEALLCLADDALDNDARRPLISGFRDDGPCREAGGESLCFFGLRIRTVGFLGPSWLFAESGGFSGAVRAVRAAARV